MANGRAASEATSRRPRIVYLVTLRTRAGLTQPNLADLSGVSQPTISRLERLQPAKNLALSTVRRLAAALGVDPDLLRFGPDPAVISGRRYRLRDRQRRRNAGRRSLKR